MLFNSNCQWIKDKYSQFKQEPVLIRSYRGNQPMESDYDIIVSN